MGFGKKKNKVADPTGYLGDMNEAQQQCLNELKEYIKANNLSQNPWFDDMYLLRFCRARKFDLKKVVEMFTNFCNWRKENGVDTILTVSLKFDFVFHLFRF